MPLACIVLPRQGIAVEGPPYLLDLGVSLLNFPFNIVKNIYLLTF